MYEISALINFKKSSINIIFMKIMFKKPFTYVYEIRI